MQAYTHIFLNVKNLHSVHISKFINVNFFDFEFESKSGSSIWIGLVIFWFVFHRFPTISFYVFLRFICWAKLGHFTCRASACYCTHWILLLALLWYVMCSFCASGSCNFVVELENWSDAVLFSFGCVSVHCCNADFLSLWVGLLCCGAQDYRRWGFSCWGAQALGAWGDQYLYACSVVATHGPSTGSAVVATRLSCPSECRIFPE